MITSRRLDIAGITASVGCAIHCLVFPCILSSLPVLGINIIENTLFECLMIGVSAVIGLVALSHGVRRHHRTLPIALFTAGMILMLGKQVWHVAEVYLLVPAVLLIVGAHYFNYRLCAQVAVGNGKH